MMLKLSSHPEVTSTKLKAITITANPAISHTIIAQTILNADFSKTAFDLKKIPVPVVTPKTRKIAEKNPIFLVLLGLVMFSGGFSSIKLFIFSNHCY